MAKLVLMLNGKIINQYFIEQPSISIGRVPGNEICISDPLLSRRHARITVAGADEVLLEKYLFYKKYLCKWEEVKCFKVKKYFKKNSGRKKLARNMSCPVQ